jgi:hypothetical protein
MWKSIKKFIISNKKPIFIIEPIIKKARVSREIEMGLPCRFIRNKPFNKKMSSEIMVSLLQKCTNKIVKNAYYSILLLTAEAKINKPRHVKSNSLVPQIRKPVSIVKSLSKAPSGYSTPASELVPNKSHTRANSQMASPKVSFRMITISKESIFLYRKSRGNSSSERIR